MHEFIYAFQGLRRSYSHHYFKATMKYRHFKWVEKDCDDERKPIPAIFMLDTFLNIKDMPLALIAWPAYDFRTGHAPGLLQSISPPENAERIIYGTIRLLAVRKPGMEDRLKRIRQAFLRFELFLIFSWHTFACATSPFCCTQWHRSFWYLACQPACTASLFATPMLAFNSAISFHISALFDTEISPGSIRQRGVMIICELLIITSAQSSYTGRNYHSMATNISLQRISFFPLGGMSINRYFIITLSDAVSAALYRCRASHVSSFLHFISIFDEWFRFSFVFALYEAFPSPGLSVGALKYSRNDGFDTGIR